MIYESNLPYVKVSYLLHISDPSTRGKLKFGDQCDYTQQCGFPGSVCFNRECVCEEDLRSTNHIDKCGKCK